MCGIVGYVGEKRAAPILLDGLERLEYRGYDSAGMAVRHENGETEIVKVRGRIAALRQETGNGDSLRGNCGIGHTRWATHGAPGVENAHPHCSDDRSVILVHNGIIENHQELRRKLKGAGYSFRSDTDTEVAAKLIDYYYKKYRGGPVEALSRSMMRFRGSYALAVLYRDYPGEIFAVRKDSPMIIGVEAGGTYLASDAAAILGHTRRVYYLGNMEIARMNTEGVRFVTVDQEPIEKQPTEITWDAESADKGGFEHFMMKEIHEQPSAVRNTLNSLIKNGAIDLSGAGIGDEEIRRCSQVHIVACGSAYHAGLVVRLVMQDLARLPVHAHLASEFRCGKPLLDSDCLVIAISQSGETADTLAALREAKAQGAKTLAVVNVMGSTIAREADHVILTCAGPEIAVATTKAYSAQLAAGYLLAVQFALLRGKITADACAGLIAEINSLPDKIQRVLNDTERIQRLASRFSGAGDAFFIGRGIDFAVAMEGSLKLKEVSYVHSEACAAGELKHGTISLLEDNTLVVGILTQDPLREKMISNMAECKSRGACLLCIAGCGDRCMEDIADFTVHIPRTDARFAASLAVVPLQLLAYYVGVARGLDVDKPRNLAKSVTVE